MLPQSKHREERPAVALWSPVSTSSHTGYSSPNSAPKAEYPPKDQNHRREPDSDILQHAAQLAETRPQRQVRFDAPGSDIGPSETAIENPGTLGHLLQSDGAPSLASLLDDKHDGSPPQKKKLSTTEILRLRTRAMTEAENAIEDQQDYDDEQPPPGSPLESAWLKLLQEPRRSHCDEDDSDEDYLYMAAPTSRKTRFRAPSCSTGSTSPELSQPPTPTFPRRHFDVGVCVENENGGSGDDTTDTDTDTADEDETVIIEAQKSHTKCSAKTATCSKNKKSSATGLLKQLLESELSAQIPATPILAKAYLYTCTDLPTPTPSDRNPYPPSPTENLEEISWLVPQTGSVGFYKGRPIVPSAVRGPFQPSFRIRPQE